MFVKIRPNKDIQAHNEGAPNKGPLNINEKGPREPFAARPYRDNPDRSGQQFQIYHDITCHSVI